MTMSRLALAATLLLVACFSPNQTKFTVRCDNENPCEAGMVCVSGVCENGTAHDLATGFDQSLPDLTPVGPHGCADGKGVYLGAAWACPGLFGGTSPAASKRCATGFAPCLNATGIALASCTSLPGFFIANFIAKASGSSVSCTAGTGGGGRGIFGCGTAGSTQASCMGFDQAIVCANSPDWQCADQIDLVTNNNLANGVLCCTQ